MKSTLKTDTEYETLANSKTMFLIINV